MVVNTGDEIFFKISLDMNIMALKRLQIEHNLFLDLEDEDIEEKYRMTYPKGTNYLNFLYMICDMTKEDNLNNKVVIDEMNMMKEKMRRVSAFKKL